MKNFNFNFKHLFVLSAVLLLGSTQVWGTAPSTTADTPGASGTVTFEDWTSLSVQTNYWKDGIKFYQYQSSTSISAGADYFTASTSIPSYHSNLTAGNNWGSYSMSGLESWGHQAFAVSITSPSVVEIVLDNSKKDDPSLSRMFIVCDNVAYGTPYNSSNYSAGTNIKSRAIITCVESGKGRYKIVIPVFASDLSTLSPYIIKMGTTNTTAPAIFVYESVTVKPLSTYYNIYQTNVTNSPTSPASASQSGTYYTSASTSISGITTTGDTWLKHSSSGGYYTLTFSPALSLSGYEDNVIDVWWAASGGNGTTKVYLNGSGSQTGSDLSVSSGKFSYGSVDIPALTTSLSSIKVQSSGNAAPCWFYVGIRGTEAAASSYTVTYNDNGKDGGGAAPTDASSPYASGSNVTVLDNTNSMTKAGYSFGGWNTAADGSGTPYAAGGTISSIAANTTLYAKWTQAITLDREGASTGSTSVTATYNCATLPSITNPTKEGYAFKGWYTGDDGTGTLVINTSGELQANVSGYTGAGGIWTSSSARTLYAKWEQFALPATLDKSNVTDYSEMSWYGSSDEYFDFGPTDAPNTSRWAEWEVYVTPCQYTISEIGYCTNGHSYYLQLLNGNTQVSTFTAVDAGHWGGGDQSYTQASKWDLTGISAGVYTIRVNNSTEWGQPKLKSLTLDATIYTVTYDANGGSCGKASEKICSGESVTLPEPTRSGYTFDGWYSAGTKIGNAGASYAPTADITLYAHWIDNIEGKLFSYVDSHYGDKCKAFDLSDWVSSNQTGKDKTYTNASTGIELSIDDGAWDNKSATASIVAPMIKFIGTSTTTLGITIPTGKHATITILYGSYDKSNKYLKLDGSNLTAPSSSMDDPVTSTSGFATVTLTDKTGTVNGFTTNSENVYIAKVAATITGYTVTFNKGTYGTGSNQTQTKTAGSSLTLADDDDWFTRDYYLYDGWSVNADGSTKDYELGGSYTTDAAITLYPHWVSNCTSPTASWSTAPADGEAKESMEATLSTNYAAGAVYTSSDESVATVSGDGTNTCTITYVSSGSARITATVTGDGEEYCTGPATCYTDITVSAAKRKFKTGETIYFKDAGTNISGISCLWVVDGGDVFAYFYDAENNNNWQTTAGAVISGCNHHYGLAIYSIEVPADGSGNDHEWTGVVFTRGTAATWDSGYFGQKTADQNPDEGKNMFTISTAAAVDGEYNGTWSFYTIGPAIVGDMNNWIPDGGVLTFPKNSDIGTVYMNLDAESTYKFKVAESATTWRGNNGTINNSVTSWWTFPTDNGNCTLNTAEAGQYAFKWNNTSKTLGLYYPRARLAKNKYIYFDSRESDWNGGAFDAKFLFKYYDSDEQIGDLVFSDSPLEDWVYYAVVPNNDYVGQVQVMRMNPSDHADQYNYANITAAHTRTSDKQNCLVPPATGWSGIDLSWGTYCPPMSASTLSDNSTPTYGGTGTSGDPYLIAPGANILVSASSTSALPDDYNMTAYYQFMKDDEEEGDGSATYTATIAASSSNTTKHKITVKAYNYYNSTSGTALESSALYYETRASYTISYDKGTYGTGSAPDNDTQIHGVALTLPGASFTRIGYTQDGWSVNENGSTKDYNLNGSYTENVADVLYPHWQINNHDITYLDPGNGNSYSISVAGGDGVSTNTTADYNQTITLAANATTGYIFTGWTVTKASSGTVEVTSNSFTMPDDDVTITASFARVYTITYDANSGSCATASATQASSGASLTLPTATRVGYTFGGWEDNKKTLIGAAGASYTPEADITLYARWTINSHTLIWNFDGGSTSDESYTAGGDLDYGTSITYPDNATMSKTGYIFDSWSTSAATMPDEDLTITASWTRDVKTAKWGTGYNAFPDETSDTRNNVTIFTTESVHDGAFGDRTYYNFGNGKYIDINLAAGYFISDIKTCSYNDPYRKVDEVEKYDVDTKLYINFCGESTFNPSAILNAEPIMLTPNAWNNWDIDTYKNTVASIPSGAQSARIFAYGSYDFGGDLFYLEVERTAWDCTPYTVSFDGGDATLGSAPIERDVCGSFTLPGSGSLVNPGYLFSKWNDGTTNYDEGDSYTVTGDVTFTAQWVIDNTSLRIPGSVVTLNNGNDARTTGTDNSTIDIDGDGNTDAGISLIGNKYAEWNVYITPGVYNVKSTLCVPSWGIYAKVSLIDPAGLEDPVEIYNTGETSGSSGVYQRYSVTKKFDFTSLTANKRYIVRVEDLWSGGDSQLFFKDIVFTPLYDVAVTLTNDKATQETGATGEDKAAYGTNYVATFEAITDYTLPTDVTVYIGEDLASKGTEYTWSVSAGVGTLTITGSYITGDIDITVTAKKAISPSLSYASTVTYGSTISPTLSGAGDGSVTYSLNDVDPAGSLTINSSTGVVTGVTAGGTATVTATITAGDDYWGGSATSSTITVAKADLSVSPAAGTATSITQSSATLPFTLASTTGVASVTLKVYDSEDELVATVAGVTAATSGSGEITGLDAGTTYYFTVTPIGDSNHNDGAESGKSATFTTEAACTPHTVSKVTMSAYNSGSKSGYNNDEYAGTPKYNLSSASGEGSTHTGYKLGSSGYYIYAQLGKGSFEEGDVIKVYVSKPNDAYKVETVAQTILDLYIHDGSSTHTFLHTIEGVDKEGEYTYTLTASDITTIGAYKYIGVYRPSSGRTQNPYIYSVEIEGCRSWTPSHDVSTVVSGSVGGTVSAAASSVMEGGTTTITATPATGYEVTNWAVSGTGASISPSGSSSSTTTTLTMGTADATVTVTFGLADYSVTYNGNSPTSGSAPTDGNTYNYNDDVTVLGDNSMSKTGYTFRGWTDGTTFYKAGEKLKMPAEDVTLKAVWESNSGSETITITDFATSNTNCSAGVPDDNEKYFYGYKGSVSAANAVTLTSNDGNDRGQNSGVEMRLTYTKKMRVYANNTTDAAPQTFKGVTGISFKWMFIASGNSGKTELTSSYTVKVGSTTVANAVSITGKTNDGYATVNLTSLANLDGYVEIQFGGSSSSYNVYLDDIAITYASPYFDVSFDDMSGFTGSSTLPSTITGVPSGNKIQEPATEPEAAGYDFDGWYTDTSCETAVNWNTMTITADKTLYAKWTEAEYSITYKDKGDETFTGGGSLPDTHTYGTITLLEDATKTGYRFDGWYDNAACTGYRKYTLGATSYTDDITLYAKWTLVVDDDNENFEGYDTPSSYNDVLITNGATLTISTDKTVQDITVETGSTLNIAKDGESGITFTVNSLSLVGGWGLVDGKKKYDMPRVFIDQASTLTKTGGSTVNLDVALDNDNYYPIAVPFPVDVSAVDYADPYLAGFSRYGFSGQYAIKKYNGQQRADRGANYANWEIMNDGFDVGYGSGTETLVPGRGYIVTALPVPGEEYAVLRFPMTVDNKWTTEGEQGSITVKVEEEDVTTTKNVVRVEAYVKEEGETPKMHKGWNLLGIPYMSCYQTGSDMYAGGGAAAIMQGKFDFSTNKFDDEDEIRYVSVPTHDFSEYLQYNIEDEGTKLLPGWCFFVQVETTGDLTYVAAKETASGLLYAPKREQEHKPTIKTGIILSSETASDKTTFLISDKYSAAEYEINADLEKMFGENSYTLATYSLAGETRLAYNAMSRADAANVIPIGYRAPAEGEYTFAINPRYAESGDFERIDLIDYETGFVTNLLQSSYTFTSDRTQSDSRFALNVVPQKETPTGLENEANDANGARKVIIDNKLYIILNGKMYDAKGVMVK